MQTLKKKWMRIEREIQEKTENELIEHIRNLLDPVFVVRWFFPNDLFQLSLLSPVFLLLGGLCLIVPLSSSHSYGSFS